jgi:hypothetical protein
VAGNDPTRRLYAKLGFVEYGFVEHGIERNALTEDGRYRNEMMTAQPLVPDKATRS